VLLEADLSLTRYILVFTLSNIIPWCVPPTNPYPRPGHVSLGITSPLLLESSDRFPVDLDSPPSSLDIVLDPWCSHLTVPTEIVEVEESLSCSSTSTRCLKYFSWITFSGVFFPRVESVSPSYNAFWCTRTLGASAT